jgi:thiaminase
MTDKSDRAMRKDIEENSEFYEEHAQQLFEDLLKQVDEKYSTELSPPTYHYTEYLKKLNQDRFDPLTIFIAAVVDRMTKSLEQVEATIEVGDISE